MTQLRRTIARALRHIAHHIDVQPSTQEIAAQVAREWAHFNFMIQRAGQRLDAAGFQWDDRAEWP